MRQEMEEVYPGKDVKMKTLLFCIDFLIILSITQTAKATITCPSENPTTHDFSGYWTLDSRFSLFVYNASNFDFDLPAIFTQKKKVSGFGEDENLNVPILPVVGSIVMIPRHFLHMSDYFDDRCPVGRSRLPVNVFVYFNEEFVKNEGFPDLVAHVSNHNPVGIQETGYDVIDIVPAPGALILGSFGLSIIGWLRRHRTL